MAPLIDDNALMCIMDDDSTASMDVDVSTLTKTPLHHTTATTTLHQTTATTTTTKSRRSVSFGAAHEVHDILSRYDMTSKEVQATWYNRVDLRQLKETAKSEARLMDCGVLRQDSSSNNDNDVCLRGLESRTCEGGRQKRQNRVSATAAVFMALDSQEDYGFVDDEAIADAYYVYSEKCLLHAQMMALRDHKDALEAWQPVQPKLCSFFFLKPAPPPAVVIGAAATAAAAAAAINTTMFDHVLLATSEGLLASSAA